MQQHSTRQRHVAATVALVVVSAVSGLAAINLVAGRTSPSKGGASAIVQYLVLAGSAPAARIAVTQVHGTVVSELPVVHGVVATLNGPQASTLARRHGVRLTRDGAVQLAAQPPAPTATPDSVFPQVTGASGLWATGDEGAGVNVAVLDTGIDGQLAPFVGRLVDGVDLTGGRQPFVDQYGHGTFVAGLIAGSASPSGSYSGEAPQAGLVSIKVAGASGVTSEGTIIEGIAWAISHRVADDIGVLNLSLGAVPQTPSLLDPLDQAAEAAWRAGIVVVTTAGNAGPANGTITAPGDDPLVITVGALDDKGTVSPSDESVAPFSGVGPTRFDGWMKPDVVAPGVSVVSVDDPGSTVDSGYPSARIAGGYFLGSGTSFAAAIVSGEAALMLSADPRLTPDQVKSRLLLTASRGPLGNPFVDGHGVSDVLAASTEPNVPTLNQNGAALAEVTSPVFGVVSSLLRPLVSLSDVWGASTWDPANWSGSAPAGLGWNIGLLPVLTPLVTGAAWNGAAWNGAAWNGAAWNGATWAGAAWNGAAWNGAAWNGAAWNGEGWNGER